jgi:hypothetical protein
MDFGAFFSDGPGVARHFWPLPRAHRRLIEYIVTTHCTDGALQTPKIPKTISQVAVHFDFRIFPDSLKQKGPTGARNRKP